jgi:hypothetical protein
VETRQRRKKEKIKMGNSSSSSAEEGGGGSPEQASGSGNGIRGAAALRNLWRTNNALGLSKAELDERCRPSGCVRTYICSFLLLLFFSSSSCNNDDGAQN